MTLPDAPTKLDTPKPAPRAKGWPLIGIAWQMRQDPLGTMTRLMTEDAMFMQLGIIKATLFRNPEHIKRIFVDNAANYTKQTRGYQKAQLVLGEGLVTSEGELWQRQRRIANPAFHRQRIAGFAETMVTATDDWLTSVSANERLRLNSLSPRERAGVRVHPPKDAQSNTILTPSTTESIEIDIFRELMTLTLHIAVQTLLGVGPSKELDRVSAAVTEVLERTNDIITNPASLPAWFPTPKNFRFRKAINTLDSFVYDTIARKRKEDAEKGTDLLSMLLSAKDDQTGEGMSDKQLRDEAVTILIAGHETTANALTWALYLLSKHPVYQSQLQEEVDRVIGNRLPTYEDWQNLPFTRAVVDEAMRLYPPAWMIGRRATKADVIGPYTVNAGEFVLISPYMTHRNPNLWDHPDEFDPKRFLDGRAAALPKFSYLPFGGGMRFCIGANFALMQATLMLARIAQRITVEYVEYQKVVPFAMITLRPKDGIKLKLRRRTPVEA